jgi:hypothetical protein
VDRPECLAEHSPSRSIRPLDTIEAVAEEAPRVECRMRFQLSDGRTWTIPWTTRRPRRIGAIFNFPVREDGTARAGKGYIWRVVRIDEGELVLEFAGQHPDQGDPDYQIYRRD